MLTYINTVMCDTVYKYYIYIIYTDTCMYLDEKKNVIKYLNA